MEKQRTIGCVEPLGALTGQAVAVGRPFLAGPVLVDDERVVLPVCLLDLSPEQVLRGPAPAMSRTLHLYAVVRIEEEERALGERGHARWK